MKHSKMVRPEYGFHLLYVTTLASWRLQHHCTTRPVCLCTASVLPLPNCCQSSTPQTAGPATVFYCIKMCVCVVLYLRELGWG